MNIQEDGSKNNLLLTFSKMLRNLAWSRAAELLLIKVVRTTHASLHQTHLELLAPGAAALAAC